MTALEYFRFFAPEHGCVPDASVAAWVTISGNLNNVGCLDLESQSMAHALYAAHEVAMAARSAATGGAIQGNVTSEKEGDLSRSYGAVKGSDSYMGLTSYGQKYLDLTRPCWGSSIMTRVLA